jgi:amino acid adenylation domain-containing protein
LLIDRGMEMAVGILGILKAGAAYVPLDSKLPAERIAFILSDTAAPAVVTRTAFRYRLAGYSGRVICADDAEPGDAEQDEAETTSGATAADKENAGPDDLAYIIYTSGSTGTPKGVMISHRALVNHATAISRSYELCASDRVLQIASPAFDVAAEEIFPTWLSGATVVAWTDTGPPVFSDLIDLVGSRHLSVLNLPASYWHGWVAELASLRLPESLRLVVVGSEPVIAARLVDWLRHTHGDINLINAYGPSETTITAIIYKVLAGGDFRNYTGIGSSSIAVSSDPSVRSVPSVPIGRPIANTEVYVLDDRLQPVPIGVAGELHIGGEGLARGYLNRPELTAERFIAHPFRPEGRVYRTGDWVRYLPDGNLEFIGRRDQQVKVRGFRVELGEVEAALHAYPGVREAVATMREDAPGDKRLIAYVVADAEEPPSASEWRRFLQERLPGYMVPSAFVAIPALPLTPNGKLDRAALPAPSIVRETEAVAPRTQDEQRLADIFAELLRIPKVGIHDNFFELGGHSLLATRAVSRIRDVLHATVPLHVLFDAPTVGELALRLGPRTPSQPIHRRPEGPCPLSFSQQRLWFLDQLSPNSPAYNICTTFAFKGLLDAAVLRQSLGEIVRRHEIMRTTFTAIDGQGIQVVMPPSPPQLAVIDLPEASAAEARRIINTEAEIPFDLVTGPLFRTTLLRIGELDHLLVLAMHHIIADGWSLGII